MRCASPTVLFLLAAVVTASAGCYRLRGSSGGGETAFRPPRPVDARDVAVPAGYRVEAVATGYADLTGRFDFEEFTGDWLANRAAADPVGPTARGLRQDEVPLVLAAEGLEILTRRPPFAITTQLLLRPRNPTVSVTFGRDGLVRRYGDLYRLTLDQLMNLERMGQRSSEKLVEGLAASKDRGLAGLLKAIRQEYPHLLTQCVETSGTDGEALMEPDADDSDGITVTDFRIPAVVTRRAETTLQMRSGQTFAIGWIARLPTEDAPGLGGIPLQDVDLVAGPMLDAYPRDLG